MPWNAINMDVRLFMFNCMTFNLFNDELEDDLCYANYNAHVRNKIALSTSYPKSTKFHSYEQKLSFTTNCFRCLIVYVVLKVHDTASSMEMA